MGPVKTLANVAIDGHAGSGKTTVAVELARQLGLVYLDTGLMYRAVALQCLRQGREPLEGAELQDWLAQLDLRIEVRNAPHPSCRMLLDGQDVTDQLHEPSVTALVPRVASISSIRRDLVSRQQAFARRGGVIMVGRDIASVVLPDAPLKVFLTADLGERARRRWLELKSKGKALTLEEVEADLEDRDRQDSQREDSPLLCVEQARLLDSTGLSAEEVVDRLSQWTLELSRSEQE